MKDTLSIDMALYVTIAGRKRKMEFEYELFMGNDCYLIYTDKKYHKYYAVFRVLKKQQAIQLLSEQETKLLMGLLNHINLVKWRKDDGVTVAYAKITEFWYGKYQYHVIAFDTQDYKILCLDSQNHVITRPIEEHCDATEQYEMECYFKQLVDEIKNKEDMISLISC